jgi:hypothetical protein
MKYELDRNVSFALTDDARHFGGNIDQPCTPDIIDGFGVVINAPAQVEFSEGGPTLAAGDAQFIICGATKFQYGSFGYGSSFARHVSIVAVDAETHESFSAPVGDAEGLSISPAPMPDEYRTSKRAPKIDHSKTTIGEVFRRNLAGLVRLPAKETEYTVYAVIDSYRSNSLTVKVVRRTTP